MQLLTLLNLTYLSTLYFPYRRTHSIYQMSLASHTSTLFHSSFNLLHMSPIKPHLHIHTTTHVPQQPSKPKHHITHLILQLFPASSLTHLDHFIPDLFQSQSKFTFIIPQASTIFHLSKFFLTLLILSICLKSISIFYHHNSFHDIPLISPYPTHFPVSHSFPVSGFY